MSKIKHLVLLIGVPIEISLVPETKVAFSFIKIPTLLSCSFILFATFILLLVTTSSNFIFKLILLTFFFQPSAEYFQPIFHQYIFSSIFITNNNFIAYIIRKAPEV